MEKLTIEEINISKTEKRLLLLLSKNEFTIKELSFIFNRDTSTIRSHLHSLRAKGFILKRTNLCPYKDKYHTKLTPEIQRLLSEEIS